MFSQFSWAGAGEKFKIGCRWCKRRSFVLALMLCARVAVSHDSHPGWSLDGQEVHSRGHVRVAAISNCYFLLPSHPAEFTEYTRIRKTPKGRLGGWSQSCADDDDQNSFFADTIRWSECSFGINECRRDLQIGLQQFLELGNFNIWLISIWGIADGHVQSKSRFRLRIPHGGSNQ